MTRDFKLHRLGFEKFEQITQDNLANRQDSKTYYRLFFHQLYLARMKHTQKFFLGNAGIIIKCTKEVLDDT